MSPEPLLKNCLKDRYTLIEQSGIYSNRTVAYIRTLIKHACKYPYVKELHSGVFHTF